ncbi:uncharacterized protein Z518_05484 [Rhinocladiella mackenziei CBS 650.93]|uniref:Holocytochrome c-type synthase n=1 Tax=Rhinocladiella mackenziei CBS 650.93 TaxID=1442369 RepID=A0A0D2IFM2_9EURO|nr:uncharacterized protein Z518_05484 [Rhinocladiella mackenziei CBS 650.93]KIX04614.1 hypothetical protein Z518_05484 [Rhinocladiella mackenziei CBS 650.93]
MGWWKADPVPEQSPSTSTIHPHPMPPSSSSTPDSTSACPIDHKTRSIWLQQAQKNSQTQTPSAVQSHPLLSSSQPRPSPTAANPTSFGSLQDCSSDRICISQSQTTPPSLPEYEYKMSRPLSHERAVSSIPRAMPSDSNNSSWSSTMPMNNEIETGTSAAGNWIYPSESQFFHAVMRKQTTSNPSDLLSSINHIIPIHNAVNERAWTLIKAWEGNSSAQCGGPKLLSFKGLGSGAISPKARIKSLMGYTEPFDRHDWVVERCGGETVEYVIDFYQGKAEGKGKENSLNFYLDVRPKLNSFEGWRLRAERFIGWR